MRKKLTVHIITMLVTLTLIIATLLVPTEVSAAFAEPVDPVNYQDDQIMPLWEETMWYTRIKDGKLQKRLWSITYGRWLTDWIDC